eukprot:2239935-Prymnesium_polylepis.1
MRYTVCVDGVDRRRGARPRTQQTGQDVTCERRRRQTARPRGDSQSRKKSRGAECVAHKQMQASSD